MTLNEKFWAIVDHNWSESELSRLVVLTKLTERRTHA